jgi:hypothetical protein
MTKPKNKNGVSKSSKKRQTEIPGTQHPDDIDEIDDAIADYLSTLTTETRVKREAKEAVTRAKAAALALMQEHKRKVYVYRDGTYKYEFKRDSTEELKYTRRSEAKETARARSAGEEPAQATE